MERYPGYRYPKQLNISLHRDRYLKQRNISLNRDSKDSNLVDSYLVDLFS